MNNEYDSVKEQMILVRREQLQKVISQLIILCGTPRTRSFICLEMNLQGLNDPAVIRESAKIEEQTNRMIGVK